MDNRFNSIELLLENNTKESLDQARELTREVLTEITENISTLFLDRQSLMGLIASSKRNSEAILQLDREYDLILKFSEIAEKNGEDKRMIEMLIWLLTASGKEKQRKILDRHSVFVKENIPIEQLKSNLLELTDLVAEKYDNYGEGFSATKMAREFEIGLLKNTINNLQKKGIALDLGCANGTNTQTIGNYGFEKVIGYDISPKMIEIANDNHSCDTCNYIEHDLFNGIPNLNESIDLVVSNFGSASEVNENIIPEVNRVLKK